MIYGNIYKIVNNVNDIIYIGQTTQNLNTRFSNHKFDSKRNTSYFYEEMLKIGTNNFQIIEIEKIYAKDKVDLKLKLIEQEAQTIRFFRNNNIKLYNIFENEDNINKHKNSIKITQLDLNDNIIKIWNSSHEVDRFYNKEMHQHINQCCKNKRKTAYKSKWKYYENDDENLIQN